MIFRSATVTVLLIAGIGIVVMVLPKTLARACYTQEMAEVKAITTIHTAETQYYSQYGHYATTLTQLGPNGAELIDKGLASGDKGGFKFALQAKPEGYALRAEPTAFDPCGGSHTYLSDQGDPLLGDPVPYHKQDN